MNLKTKTIQGVGWSGMSQAIRLLLHFIVIAILARLLTPKDFGLLAMTVVFTGFVMTFCDFGITAALIQHKKLTEEHLSSSFWINVLTGFVLTLLLIIVAPLIANFYNESRLTLIISVLSLTFFIYSFSVVQTALFTKELDFKSLAVVEISAVLISGIIAIILAFSGFGVWSLVWQQLISIFVKVIFLWKLSDWKPKFLFKWQRFKELLWFGLNLTGFSFVNYFKRNFDDLLIGKFFGPISLGFYNLAYQLLLFPLSNISQVIGRVMFPSLSIIQSDKDKMRYSYLKATRYIAVITFPLMVWFLVVAPQFIRVVFGSQWERSIFLVQIFALVGLMQSIGTTVGWIYQSQGRTDIMFRWGIFTSIVTAAAFILGLRWNIEGVAIACAITGLFLTYPNFAIPFKLIDLKFSHFVKQFKSIFLATLGMGGIVFVFSAFMENVLGANNLIILVLAMVVSVMSYFSILFISDRLFCYEIFYLLKQLKSLLHHT
ncbi:MAG: MOP flippase family protein [Candidatus Andersenbacteria bacterium]|nr:MOP flippase family protein [Candidatus Andersenbacteria bacterium]